MPLQLIADISPDDILRAGTTFEKREGRDSVYRLASYLLKALWEKMSETVDALTVFGAVKPTTV